jgi:hypothetical protein
MTTMTIYEGNYFSNHLVHCCALVFPVCRFFRNRLLRIIRVQMQIGGGMMISVSLDSFSMFSKMLSKMHEPQSDHLQYIIVFLGYRTRNVSIVKRD